MTLTTKVMTMTMTMTMTLSDELIAEINKSDEEKKEKKPEIDNFEVKESDTITLNQLDELKKSR